MFEHNSGTPRAISTKLGTHIAICVCKNLMYIVYQVQGFRLTQHWFEYFIQ
jgi:hypothetical protein